MRALMLAAGALAFAAAAHAQSAVTTQESGVRSAPIAGATPQARENPSPGTTMLEQRERTTVTEPRTTVIEERGSSGVAVESRTKVRTSD
ncbi:hypothetical protein [Hansschlegelia zhihuaiae]|uniref:Uncharacterized protein n=1 Tax=Hansschlegelia zhihuaiae TaxID=405005 RepID=A0A4Q0MJS4_9HYPH|nr:hypothetical protein [Hansschlegelia zhihuaiae]RXF73971.1 hypothetical protein EK403_08370 [Hansschlegelia zhihuaiae]